jgi:hypothetical protein
MGWVSLAAFLVLRLHRLSGGPMSGDGRLTIQAKISRSAWWPAIVPQFIDFVPFRRERVGVSRRWAKWQTIS